uniref:Group II intron reverse transcriptase/maturase n=1 Tax=Juglanconis juglandina TaxID=1940567 RepID=A0A291LJ54_9PEZI|nr:group II intron reverse transcriptase/maturase [Juglanconis juglandina]
MRGWCPSIVSLWDVHSSNMFTTAELGRGESSLLNIASQLKSSTVLNLTWVVFGWVGLSMVKAKLLQDYYSLSSCSGRYHGRDGISTLPQVLNGGICGWGSVTRLLRKGFKNKNGQPKESVRMRRTTTGLPTGSNSHGNRVTIVPSLYVVGNFTGNGGRVAVNFASSSRSYSTGCDTASEANIIKKLEDLFLRSKSNPNMPIDRNLYKLVCDIDLLNMAYDKLKSHPGQMTPGVNPETLDGMSIDVLANISNSLKSEKFDFHPGRRVQIPKRSGGTRPLTIASPRDKIVQEAMRMVLEAVYEPLFSAHSHGFRPLRGCHTALKEVKEQFQPSVWVIEGDISKCFDSIDHHKLMGLIEKKISDRKFTRLIWKSLRAGFFEFHRYQNNIAGTPQGSIISPILANIFMSQLDEFVEGLITKFNRGTKSRPSTFANTNHSRIYRAKRKGDMELVRKLSIEGWKHPWANFSDPSFKKLSYVRYADDWVVGVKGTLKEAKEFLSVIDEKLGSMGLALSKAKTKLTNLNSSSFMFLGTKISRASEFSFARKSGTSLVVRNSKKLRLMAPLPRIVTKLHETDFMEKGKSSPKFVWLSLEHRQIVHLYNSVLRGYLNYYSFVHNYGKLVSRLTWILKSSCAKLLAAKFSLRTESKVISKFGPQLNAPTMDKGKNGQKEMSFLKPSYKITLKFLTSSSPIIKSLYGSKSLATLDGLVCSVCGSEYRVEMHHVRHLKDLNPKLSLVDKLMARRRRKQIALCRNCHMRTLNLCSSAEV